MNEVGILRTRVQVKQPQIEESVRGIMVQKYAASRLAYLPGATSMAG